MDRETLREALLRQDFGAVMRRLSVRGGDGVRARRDAAQLRPDTLIYEIEQTSDIQQHAMYWVMEDGSTLDDERWRSKSRNSSRS